MGTSHRQAPVKGLVRRVREGLADAVRPARRLRGGARQRRDDGVLGRRHVRPDPRPRSALGTYGEFSAKFASGVAEAPFLADPVIAKAEPGLAGAADGRGRASTPTRWAHNETSTGVMAPVVRPAGRRRRRAGPHRRDQRRRRPAGRRRADRRLLLRAAEVLRLRRRPVGRADVAGARWRGSPRSRRPGRWIPGFLDLSIAVDNSRQGPDLQHPGRRHAVPAGRPDRLAAVASAGSPAPSRAPASPSEPAVRLGGEVRRTPPRSWPTRRTGRCVVGTIDFADSRRRRARSRRRCARNGVVDTEPYRKLGRNQLRVGMFPAVDPDDVSALTACIDYVVERL